MMDFGSLPQFGGGSMYPGGPMTMAGPTGFSGQMPFGMSGVPQIQDGGMFGNDPKKKKGFNPLMFLSPLAGMFMSGHPNIGLGMISPGLGIARALGAFK